MATTVLTLAELESFFLAWMAAEVRARRSQDRTLRYYRTWLNRFTAAVGGDRPVAELVAFDLERHKSGWHSVQTVQRLFNWAVDAGLVAGNPFKKVKRPPLGERERILGRADALRLLRRSRPELRRLLLALRLTLARPQELRGLRWCDYDVGAAAFILNDFKAKKRRKDKKRQRLLPVVPRLARLLERLRRRDRPAENDPIFRSASGRAWTANALRLAVRRAARRAALDDPGQEPVVAYTLRHTGATEAMAAGVSDRVLAELMGHTSTRTTARYQHPQIQHLVDALQQATRRRRA